MQNNDEINEKKICFIICSNHELYTEECIKHIRWLELPKGYEAEILTIKEAASMTAGYNEGMQASNAKYKIYLHQDVFFIYKYMIQQILEIFQDPKIGMIGTIGAEKMPESQIMWQPEGRRCGGICGSDAYFSQMVQLGRVEGAYQEVEVIDGLIMVTQYDIPWREDIFDGWDYYDCSQSKEFTHAGYKVVVAKQERIWCIHYDGFLNLSNFYHYRGLYIDTYVKDN